MTGIRGSAGSRIVNLRMTADEAVSVRRALLLTARFGEHQRGDREPDALRLLAEKIDLLLVTHDRKDTQ